MKNGIICAVKPEVALFKEEMKVEHQAARASMDFFVGKLGICDVVVVQSGMGKVNAAICAQILIAI